MVSLKSIQAKLIKLRKSEGREILKIRLKYAKKEKALKDKYRDAYVEEKVLTR